MRLDNLLADVQATVDHLVVIRAGEVVAAGPLSRSSASSPSALANLFLIGTLVGVGRWITTGETYGWVLNGEWAGHGGQIARSTVIWIALPLALGMARTLGRDVSGATPADTPAV